MALSLKDCRFFGPALPEPFVLHKLEDHLEARGLLRKATGPEGRMLQETWEVYRQVLRSLGQQAGPRQVYRRVLEPLATFLGYGTLTEQESVRTREGDEDGGWLFQTQNASARLRVFSIDMNTDLDAPNKRGRAYRFSPALVAQRVLKAQGERIGLLSDGQELRILLCDPIRPDSHIQIALTRSEGWLGFREVPDSFRLLLALAGPDGVAAISDLVEKARLAQIEVTRELRRQAQKAVAAFIQGLWDHPDNQEWRTHNQVDQVARALWQEGLVLIYRLLFILKMESDSDPARAFSFSSTSAWRNTFSPSLSLAGLCRKVLDNRSDTGGLLEQSLRALFRLFLDGIACSELRVAPLGGMLFGRDSTPTLDDVVWGDGAVARLLDCLLWTEKRERVHYGTLDVEDLGRVYEALLELEPGIAAAPMARLKRAKLEIVVPMAQAEPFKRQVLTPIPIVEEEDESGTPDMEIEEEEEESPLKGKGTPVVWVEDIPIGRFFLRVGLGRKASGAYYTPKEFVRFLVRETLGPQIAERSPRQNPNPMALLGLKVLDPTMGSGHFLVEACRFLGEHLYEACRLCDESASELERKADQAVQPEAKAALKAKAAESRLKIEALPDPNDEMLAYLPSRVLEGGEAGISQQKAMALCRRLVAVHCLYGVDKNPLAVELAKLALWLESYAEGMPLTFLDHRLRSGDSLTGPSYENLLTFPLSGKPLDDAFTRGLPELFRQRMALAQARVQELEATVGKDLADLEAKAQAKVRLDESLMPFKVLAAAWSGAVLLGEDGGDDQKYAELAHVVAEGVDVETYLTAHPGLASMVEKGSMGIPFDLTFPEIMQPDEKGVQQGGFHAILGNPPWDSVQPLAKEFFAAFDLRVLTAPTRKERGKYEEELKQNPEVAERYRTYCEEFNAIKRLLSRTYQYEGRSSRDATSGAVKDLWQGIAERNAMLARPQGFVGTVLPSAFHANQSATGIRLLYLEKLAIKCCYSFENRGSIFEIHKSFKFATVVAQKKMEGTSSFSCAFYLQDLEWLSTKEGALEYTREFVEWTGGSEYTFQELRNPEDIDLILSLYRNTIPYGNYCSDRKVKLGRELHMTDDDARFVDTHLLTDLDGDPRDIENLKALHSKGYLPLHEGKTFHQFTDKWEDRPRYCVPIDRLKDKKAWRRSAQYYRLAFRSIASSTNERTAIFSMLPFGVLFGNSAPSDRLAHSHPYSESLLILGFANTFPFDWTLRQKSAANVNQFILNGCPVPIFPQETQRFLSHSALRLTCNHAGYLGLWTDQVGEVWLEPSSVHTWPILSQEGDRWRLRACMDAVVASAYNLDRTSYEKILSSFSHTSYPEAPDLCLTAFDELESFGIQAFREKYDPYLTLPLNQDLPRPSIKLLTPEEELADSFLGSKVSKPKKAKKHEETKPAPVLSKDNLTPIQRQAVFLAKFIDLHRGHEKESTLGSVKAEKACHLVEGIFGVDFGRVPERRAAGPVDFNHLQKVFFYAEKKKIFRDVLRPGGAGHVLQPLDGLTREAMRFDNVFEDNHGEILNLMKRMVEWDTLNSEGFATLYAVWNDLLVQNLPYGVENIITEFYKWSEAKKKFPEENVRKALNYMRINGLVPTGNAKTSRSISN